jgi:hypothetical protein
LNFKAGDIVKDSRTGSYHELMDVQYNHNRYQFRWGSGWKYGFKYIKKIKQDEIVDILNDLSEAIEMVGDKK